MCRRMASTRTESRRTDGFGEFAELDSLGMSHPNCGSPLTCKTLLTNDRSGEWMGTTRMRSIHDRLLAAPQRRVENEEVYQDEPRREL